MAAAAFGAMVALDGAAGAVPDVEPADTTTAGGPLRAGVTWVAAALPLGGAELPAATEMTGPGSGPYCRRRAATVSAGFGCIRMRSSKWLMRLGSYMRRYRIARPR